MNGELVLLQYLINLHSFSYYYYKYMYHSNRCLDMYEISCPDVNKLVSLFKPVIDIITPLLISFATSFTSHSVVILN